MKGSRALLKMLEDKGVETMFGYPGGVVIPIYDEILDSSIRHVLVRHEQCAAHMADGFARASGFPGVCMATSGPGATNLVTGVATAYADSSPMIALTGQVGTASLGLDAFQEVDAYSLMMPITKHNFRVLELNRLPHAVLEAWDICQTGRPGPVHIDFPADQINANIDEALLNETFGIKVPKEDYSGIDQAVQWIKEAQRPVMMVGGGVISANASAELIKLAEMTNIPVITPLMGIGAIPTSHPLCLGSLGMHGRMCSLHAFRDADLIIAIGTKFSDRTYSAQTAPAKSCRIIQIDIDPTVFNKHGRERINIAGDAKKAMRMLIDKLGGHVDNHKPWDANIQDLKKRCKCKFNYDQTPILPQKVMYEINRITSKDPGDYIITTDVGQNQMWAMHYLEIERPRHFISSGSFGTMGFGLPSAIGAKAACPDKKVMTVTGDGGLQMVMQDIATSVAEDFPIVICLLNNGWLGMVRQWQKLFWNRRFSNTELKADPDFVKIAEAFGAKGIRVERSGEVGDALKQAFDSDVTCLVEIMVDCEEDITPMIPANPAQPLVKGRCKFQ
ncbi:3D-(3,5/4)-trihydroxycyclohexane-1,2-dione hydrolase [Candidatus Methanoplasma termitum]|uniref:Acetolactate synthase n=1 Tax=Candidatus Methanoplasma termitum TaxID=1577791 RepID=A0A0A7LCG9_9ARCH|nr:biosynthetic-type acetolactate synthase large subunit [Candidatus Methanoplasma termitum]AIZ55997.1 3D-(3,5/4)-trihydroxycyclohexane-1,2-dione hydrolase [Candidatus Methanoplasma termitum]MCL2333953.1 biosynthetic-type acetolactate synthase large subunit [Candidatus Methanoplasma sp.]